MRFGFYLPTRGKTCTPQALATLVQHAEKSGFSSTMVGDHLVFPVTVKSTYPYTASGVFPGGGEAMEQLSTIAFLAAKTTTLRLVTSVLIVPQRNPVATAKVLSTIDVLSGGRLTLGIGVGWMREEFEALDSQDFDRRGAVTDEYVKIFKTLWTGEPVSFSGRFYRFDPVRCLPKPVQTPHIPIWIGGSTKAALRRTASYGDGWHPVGANPAVPLPSDELIRSRDDLFRQAEANGRDPKQITISYKVPVSDPALVAFYAKSGEKPPFSGTLEEIVEDTARYAKLGVSELIFDFRSENLDESLERMERFSAVIRQTSSM